VLAARSSALNAYAEPALEALISVVIVVLVTAVTFLPPEAADSNAATNPSVSPPSTV
tara:strand:+ start:759 stop:929 length:171 start_codon:yes stop_codon:yes gene_type:complete